MPQTPTDVEVVAQPRAELGEGPLWDDEAQVLFWLDILSSRLFRYDPRSGVNDTWDTHAMVGVAALRASGGLVLATSEGFWSFDPERERRELLARVEDRPGNRMNDGNVDSRGRLLAGTMSPDEVRGAGTLYRLETDHTVVSLVPNVTISNGIDWSRDGRLMYYVDTPTGGIDVFTYDAETGALEGRERFVTIAEGEGWPDGLTVDADGCIWVALYGGWSVRRYTPDGNLDRVIQLPTEKVTSCQFGGADLGDLYITTALEHMPDEERPRQPLAGSLFVCRPGVQGVPPHRYGG